MDFSQTCCLNSAVQMLFQIQHFTSFLKNNEFNRNHHPLLVQLLKLRQYWQPSQAHNNTSRQNYSNKDLLNCLQLKNKSLISSRQEDSVEFFETLIDEIEKEMQAKHSVSEWRGELNLKNLLETNMIQ